MATIVCPICGQSDQIQKVTSIRNTGVATGSFSGPTGGLTYSNKQWGSYGGFTTLSGSTSTQLAQMLEAPAKPRPKTYSDIAGWLGAIFGIPFLVFMIAAAGFFSVIILRIAFKVPADTIDAIVTTASTPALILIGALLLAVFLRYQERRKREFDLKYTEENERRLAEWQGAMANWNRAFYCFRDDRVFDPETGQHATPQDLTAFLYDTGNSAS